MKEANMPVSIVKSFKLGGVQIPTAAGPQTCVDLFADLSTTASSQTHTKRLRLMPPMLDALVRDLLEAQEKQAEPANGVNKVQRLLVRGQIQSVTVQSQAGDQLAFLLTLEQTNTSKGHALPVQVLATPDQILGLAQLLQAAIAEHQLGMQHAPSSSTKQ